MSKGKNKGATPQLAQVDIGALLANKRKHKNVSLERAATTINLPKNIVEKLENDDFASIGAPVYVRGYLSLYAKYLGFDVAEIVQLYNTQYPTDNVALRSALPHTKGGMVKKERKRHSKTVSLLVSALFFGGLLYAYYYVEPLFFNKFLNQEETSVVEDSANKPTTETNTDNLIDEVKSVQNLAGDVLKGQMVAGNSDLASDTHLNTITLESTLDEATDQSKEKNTDTADKSMGTEENKTNDIVKNNMVKMTFSDDCWLKITDADGKVVATGVYTPKKSLSVEGKLPMKLNTARVSVIKSVMLGDKEISLESNRLSKRRFEIK
ncbi:MAG: helix-turn-helix domain-containing protein [Gammaproteobacteria bacterium]|nr:helix-turn-helix domain-containing protein [Gammaproteobacteria bacterium]